jgi:glutamate 5-kinase
MATRSSSSRSGYIFDTVGRIHTLVLKVGSRIIIPDTAAGQKRLKDLVADIATISATVDHVILVSSGAISYGMHHLGLSKRPTTIPARQACASIGQMKLMQNYEALFGTHGRHVGQVLVTWNDFSDKQRYLNLRNTLFQLLEYKAIPIINENDSIGVEEIRFGENDKLGAQLAMLMNADAYMILTDVDGLYDRNPHTNKDAQHIKEVHGITPQLCAHAGYQKNEISVGGMKTKLEAADMVTRAGIYAVIGNGFHRRLQEVFIDPDAATIFHPSQKKMEIRRRWLAFSGKVKGRLYIDDGAADALLHRGKSLLPAGITSVEGTFQAGDAVDILPSYAKEPIARGFTNYPAADVHKIRGNKTAAITKILGEKPFNVVVHRNNMVLLH